MGAACQHSGVGADTAVVSAGYVRQTTRRPPRSFFLWAKLYEVTRNATWLAAAEAAAKAVGTNYLQPGAFQINGGELDDVMVNDGSLPGGLNVHGVSAGTYGVMGLSQLAVVTNNPEHVGLVRTSMDFMLAWQWTRDINMGWYNSKARFQGADMKTVGASVNGMVRSEVTLHSWMAYQATGDERCKDTRFMRFIFIYLTWVFLSFLFWFTRNPRL